MACLVHSMKFSGLICGKISQTTNDFMNTSLCISCSHVNLRPQAAEILERDGLNELEKPPKPTLLLLFLMQCPGCVLIADSLEPSLARIRFCSVERSDLLESKLQSALFCTQTFCIILLWWEVPVCTLVFRFPERLRLTSFIIVLLMVSAVASVLVNATGPKAGDPLSYTTGIAIGLIVLINAGIAAWTESKAGDALEALSKMTQANIYVLRDGKEVQAAPWTSPYLVSISCYSHSRKKNCTLTRLD